MRAEVPVKINKPMICLNIALCPTSAPIIFNGTAQFAFTFSLLTAA